MRELPENRVAPSSNAPWWLRRACWTYDGILAGELLDHADEPAERMPVQVEPVGAIDLPEGRLVACDPYVGEVGPFVQRVPVGAAQVLAVRALVGPDHERVAALCLVWGAGPVVEWQMGVEEGQDPSTLGEGEYFGYGVDAGTGSFGNPAAMDAAVEVLAEDDGALADPISTALFARDANVAVASPTSGASSVAVCTSGWGDGVYPTWFGLDADGVVVIAMTDFLVCQEPSRIQD